MPAETIDTIIPVVTLLLGATIGWFVKRSDTRRAARIEAGDTLAALPPHVWEKEAEHAWLDLQVYLSKLRLRLRAAGVPPVVVDAVMREAIAHWHSVEQMTDDWGETGWAGDTKRVLALNAATDDAQQWLFGGPLPFRRMAVRYRRRRGQETDSTS